MKLHKSLNMIAVILILTAVSCSLAHAAWPQTFKLYAGQNVKFPFEVTSPGQIAVNATWQGCGLYVVVLDPSGKAVLTPTLQGSPVTLTYTATDADIQKGTQWTVGIATPPAKAPSQAPVAQGQVDVKAPAIYRAPAAQRPPQRPVIPQPAIQSITPNMASPNDTVVITGVSIPADMTQAEVWFTIAQNENVQGTILKTTKTGDFGMTYDVRVPGDDRLTKEHDGQVYVKIKSGMSTNTLPFGFDPCPPPTITGREPQYGAPGRQMTFTGTRFKPSDLVYFIAPDRSELGASSQFVSATQMTVKVPYGYPTNTKSLTVYIRAKCGVNGCVFSQRYAFPMDPAVITK